MKHLFTLVSILLLFSLASCETDDCFDGKVRFTNISTNPYYLYIDDEFKKELSGNTFIEYDLLEGQHSAKVEQVSGYLLFPTIKETTLNVFGCKESEWVFP